MRPYQFALVCANVAVVGIFVDLDKPLVLVVMAITAFILGIILAVLESR